MQQIKALQNLTVKVHTFVSVPNGRTAADAEGKDIFKFSMVQGHYQVDIKNVAYECGKQLFVSEKCCNPVCILLLIV